jgi:hypothetical protein
MRTVKENRQAFIYFMTLQNLPVEQKRQVSIYILFGNDGEQKSIFYHRCGEMMRYSSFFSLTSTGHLALTSPALGCPRRHLANQLQPLGKRFPVPSSADQASHEMPPGKNSLWLG